MNHNLPPEIIKKVLFYCHPIDRINFSKIDENFPALWYCDECETFQKIKKGIFKTKSFNVKGADIGKKYFDPNSAKFICNQCILDTYSTGTYCCNCHIYTDNHIRVVMNRQALKPSYNRMMFAEFFPQAGPHDRVPPIYFDFYPQKGSHDHIQNLSTICFECFNNLRNNNFAKINQSSINKHIEICDICNCPKYNFVCYGLSHIKDKGINTGHDSKYEHDNGYAFFYLNDFKPRSWKGAKYICDSCIDDAIYNNFLLPNRYMVRGCIRRIKLLSSIGGLNEEEKYGPILPDNWKEIQ